MPFTFAHPAIVLPLNKFGKRWVSLTGLVIGSIVPDFEYFLRLKVLSLKSHTLSGLFYFDLFVGVLLFVIYNYTVKETLVAHLPQWLNRRFLFMQIKPTNHFEVCFDRIRFNIGGFGIAFNVG